MSEEDAFLDGIAADRADRTRLLVFADWLADRSDPREEFIRLHAKLLDMDGTEPVFNGLNERWKDWTGGQLSSRWLDALCRVFTASDAAGYVFYPWNTQLLMNADRWEYEPAEQIDSLWAWTQVFYRGKPDAFESPLDFLTRTVIQDLSSRGTFRFRGSGTNIPLKLVPLTCGAFWRAWGHARSELLDPREFPTPDADNRFLGAQQVWSHPHAHAEVALHEREYFALFAYWNE
jgi:uncharacterized protein (TIGR02996 family)